MKPILVLATLICLALSVPASLNAGVIMVNSHESFENAEQATITKVFVDSDRVRIETGGEMGHSVMIFRGDKQTMWIIAPDKQSYQELTKEQIDRFGEQMGGRMADMRKQMEEQLKNMPPERRAMVEKMMKSRMGGMPMAAPPTSKTEYSLVASGQQINQWTCDKYEGVRDGEKRREIWTVPPGDVGFEAADFQVMRQMAEFINGLSQFGGAQADQANPFRVGRGGDGPDFSGVPVRRINYQAGRPSSRDELKEVRREDFDATLFEVPDGFKKTQMFGGSGNDPFRR